MSVYDNIGLVGFIRCHFNTIMRESLSINL